MGQNLSDCGSCRNNSEDNMFGIKSTISDPVRIDYTSIKQNSDYFVKKRYKRRRRKRKKLI
jgi:hypothetical protein